MICDVGFLTNPAQASFATDLACCPACLNGSLTAAKRKWASANVRGLIVCFCFRSLLAAACKLSVAFVPEQGAHVIGNGLWSSACVFASDNYFHYAALGTHNCIVC